MIEIKLLILDDDEQVTNSYDEVIKRINRDDESLNYKTYIANTLEQAEEYIKYNKLDTAVIDLNLCRDASDMSNADGNKAIEEIMHHFRMPIFIVSGELGKLDAKYERNNLIKTKTRDDSISDVFKIDIPSVYTSKSMQYFSRNGYLEQKINDFYWNHLEKTLESWSAVAESNSEKFDTILSRHTVSCLNEQLYVNGNIGSFDKYHPGEMYIMPPIKKHYHTGDIIKKDNEFFIILNPACDIVNQNNLDYYILAKVVSFDSLNMLQEKINVEALALDSFYSRLNQGGKTRYDDCKSNKKDRFHYLPTFDIFEDKLIDFQQIENKEKAEINSFSREASISSPFLKDIIARFSQYYARQGQPNLLF
ncbi:MAG: hypothetical protein AB7D38_08245 [Sulfurimonas sp.]|uniref:hypothetical protein n=1 Tax=Sulfurimonas sp. TaxID=2022749 RepID=UPI003D144016